VIAQMPKKRGNIILQRHQQHAIPAFNKLRKGAQVAQISFAGKRPQALFDAQIGLIVLQQREIASAFHTFDYPRVQDRLPLRRKFPYHVHQGINISNSESKTLNVKHLSQGSRERKLAAEYGSIGISSEDYVQSQAVLEENSIG
jgi:hypothetical protein